MITTHGELTESLTQVDGYFVGLDVQDITDIVASAKFLNGRIVHLAYGPIARRFGDAGLKQLVSKLGLSWERFSAIRDSSCNGSPGVCLHMPDEFCDPDACRRG